MASFRKKLRKVLKIAGAAAAIYFGAPYLLAAGGTVLSGAGTALAGRVFAGGGGRAPPEAQQSPVGQTFFTGGAPGGGGGVGYSDIGAGGAGAGIYPGGGFDAPASPSISPGLMLGIAGGGIALIILTMLIRR